MAGYQNPGHKDLNLSFEEQALVDLRSVLFAEGLTPQQFFTYIVHRTIMKDERCRDFVLEAVDFKRTCALSRGDYKSLTADDIYSLIEQKDTDTHVQ